MQSFSSKLDEQLKGEFMNWTISLRKSFKMHRWEQELQKTLKYELRVWKPQ